MIINITKDIDFNNHCYLYWIRKGCHQDISVEGYVGITIKPNLRLAHHNCKLSKRYKAAKQGYSPELINDYEKENLYFEVVHCGSREEMQRMEYYLRPTERIGYNVAVGGEINGVCSRYKHGGSIDYVMYNRFKNFLDECLRNGVYVDPNFTTDYGFKLFCLHLEDNTVDIKTKRKRVFLKNLDEGFVLGNFYLDINQDNTDNSKWVFYNGKWWSKKEACEFNGIEIKTADKRISKYKMNRLQAVGFEPHTRSNEVVVILGGVNCIYDKTRSNFSQEDLVDIYNFYISCQRGFGEYCKNRGVHPRNMIRYFKRYNLDKAIDRRTKKFITGVFN